MPKKLAVGARKAGMAGKQYASKRELIDSGRNKVLAKRDEIGYGEQGDRKRATKRR